MKLIKNDSVPDGVAIVTSNGKSVAIGLTEPIETIHPIKWHGGKYYLAKWIVSRMPARALKPNGPDAHDFGWLHYVEPYFGGGAVLLANDPTGISEVVNDIDGNLINFWRVLGDDSLFAKFKRRCEATSTGKVWYDRAIKTIAAGDKIDQVDRAVAFFVVNRQSMAGRMDCFTPIARTRTRRGMNELPAAWLSAVDGLPAVHRRLSRVVLFNECAVDVIRDQDGERTLFYLDPPYVHLTRASADAYAHEMSDRAHAILLATLAPRTQPIMNRGEFQALGGSEPYDDFVAKFRRPLVGRFMLSAYRNPLYDQFARAYGWRREEETIANHAAGGKTKRTMTECLYLNF